MESIVTKLGTSFSEPEIVIVQSNTPDNGIFFVANGDCAVNIVMPGNVEIIAHRLLIEGDHFGEISTIYGVPSTASVISRNYNTMATLSRQKFLDLVNEIPDYKTHLMRHVYSYDDPMKQFAKKIITRIPYFGQNYLNKHLFHLILYNFQLKFYPADEIVMREKQEESDRILIVISGVLEVYTEFEGNEFIIDRLKPGSILNYRLVFTDDLMQVSVRTLDNTQTIELTEDKLREIMSSDQEFEKKLRLYENQILRHGSIPLDYLLSSTQEAHPAKFNAAKRRKNVLKNVIFKKI